MSSNLFVAPGGCITAQFWSLAPSSTTTAAYGARNLYDLFIHDLAALVSGACQANQAAHSLYPCLPADEICLREAVIGFAEACHACLPRLPQTLLGEGLVLPPTHNASVCALLATIQPEARASLFEPWSVIGTRTLGALRNAALCLKANIMDAAEIAGLLGSAALQEALGQWAGAWSDYLASIQSRELGFRAQAYAAGLSNDHPNWQHA